MAFGESLGSFGGQSAFAGAQDMLSRTDGALWVGTPNFAPQWSAASPRTAIPVRPNVFR